MQPTVSTRFIKHTKIRKTISQCCLIKGFNAMMIVACFSSQFINLTNGLTDLFINRSPFVYTQTVSSLSPSLSKPFHVVETSPSSFKPLLASPFNPKSAQQTNLSFSSSSLSSLNVSSNRNLTSSESSDDLQTQQTIWRPYFMMPRLHPPPLMSADYANPYMSARPSAASAAALYPYLASSSVYDDLPFGLYPTAPAGPMMMSNQYEFEGEPTAGADISRGPSSGSLSAGTQHSGMDVLAAKQRPHPSESEDPTGPNLNSAPPAPNYVPGSPVLGSRLSSSPNVNTGPEVELVSPLNMKSVSKNTHLRTASPHSTLAEGYGFSPRQVQPTKSNSAESADARGSVTPATGGRPMPILVGKYALGEPGTTNIKETERPQSVQPSNFRHNYSQIRKQSPLGIYWPPARPSDYASSTTRTTPPHQQMIINTPNSIPSTTSATSPAQPGSTEKSTLEGLSGSLRNQHLTSQQQALLLKKLHRDNSASTSPTGTSPQPHTDPPTNTYNTPSLAFSSAPNSVGLTDASDSSLPTDNSTNPLNMESEVSGRPNPRKSHTPSSKSTAIRYAMLFAGFFAVFVLLAALAFIFWRKQTTGMLDRWINVAGTGTSGASASGTSASSGRNHQPPPLDTSSSIYGIRRFYQRRGNLSFSPSFFPSSAAAAAAASAASAAGSNNNNTGTTSRRANHGRRNNNTRNNSLE